MKAIAFLVSALMVFTPATSATLNLTTTKPTSRVHTQACRARIATDAIARYTTAVERLFLSPDNIKVQHHTNDLRAAMFSAIDTYTTYHDEILHPDSNLVTFRNVISYRTNPITGPVSFEVAGNTRTDRRPQEAMNDTTVLHIMSNVHSRLNHIEEQIAKLPSTEEVITHTPSISWLMNLRVNLGRAGNLLRTVRQRIHPCQEIPEGIVEREWRIRQIGKNIDGYFAESDKYAAARRAALTRTRERSFLSLILGRGRRALME